jgi:hypothetical protein
MSSHKIAETLTDLSKRQFALFAIRDVLVLQRMTSMIPAIFRIFGEHGVCDFNIGFDQKPVSKRA